MNPLTPWVKRLLIANVAVYFLIPRQTELYMQLALLPQLLPTRPWTGLTYQFLHGGVGHIFFNMIALYFFGPRLEERMGGRAFMTLYLGSGFGGAVASLFFAPIYPVVGASGAVYGVLVAYAALWPRTVIHIWGILPVEAWALATIMVGVSLWSGFSGAGGGVAHFAHLGGIGFGYGYLKWWDWRKGAAKREFQKKLEIVPPSGGGGVVNALGGDQATLARWEAIDTEALHELNREEVETLLEKARGAGGWARTPPERPLLERMVRA